MTAADVKHGHVVSRLAHEVGLGRTLGTTCEACCDWDGPGRPASQAVALVHLDPRDYQGLNMGPDVACTLAVCGQCLSDLLPWASTQADVHGVQS